MERHQADIMAELCGQSGSGSYGSTACVVINTELLLTHLASSTNFRRTPADWSNEFLEQAMCAGVARCLHDATTHGGVVPDVWVPQEAHRMGWAVEVASKFATGEQELNTILMSCNVTCSFLFQGYPFSPDTAASNHVGKVFGCLTFATGGLVFDSHPYRHPQAQVDTGKSKAFALRLVGPSWRRHVAQLMFAHDGILAMLDCQPMVSCYVVSKCCPRITNQANAKTLSAPPEPIATKGVDPPVMVRSKLMETQMAPHKVKILPLAISQCVCVGFRVGRREYAMQPVLRNRSTPTAGCSRNVLG